MYDMTIRFSQWLDRSRKAKALTLQGLGERVGSGKGYMCGILAEDVNPPSTKVCSLLAKVFGVSPEYVTFMAYRDKAPEPVRQRLEVFEILRETTARLRAAKAKIANQVEIRSLEAQIDRTLDVLDRMWAPASGANGNGNRRAH